MRRAARLAALAFAGSLSAPPAWAGSSCPGYSACPPLDYRTIERTDPDLRADRNATAKAELAALQTAAQSQGVEQRAIALGAALVNDVNLSVGRNQACSTCHVTRTGDASGVRAVNRSSGVMSGSVIGRAGSRNPPSLAYAFFAPVLVYDPALGQFVGGTLRDMRATGAITGYPTADQAMVPLLSPFEMAMPDPACVVWRVSQGAYAQLFAVLWGAQSFQIAWPADVASICAVPNSSARTNPTALSLGAADRAQAQSSFRNIAFSIAQYESSAAAVPFSSRFDLARTPGSKVTLTAAQQAGLALFTGKAHCAACHSATGVSGQGALFTNFQAANVGTPRNPDLPFLHENEPDQFGYIANPAGAGFRDRGLGAVLANTAEWSALAPRFMGAFQVPTLRNAAQAPRGLVRAYTHNGYFTSLRDIVHFYNTRDVLDRCPSKLQRIGETDGTHTVGTTCWPAPEMPANVNATLTGALGLNVQEEAALVAFIGALSDGQ